MENPQAQHLKLPDWARAIVAILTTRQLTRQDRRYLKRMHADCTDTSIDDFLQAYTAALKATLDAQSESDANADVEVVDE